MSFKRDGDNKYALNNLRRQRVSDLLYEDIQEGEVSKLRNGRYLCKVCSHCPTFDTLSMFQVHKQGKKHQNSLEYQEIEKQELQDLIQKRQHEQGDGYGGLSSSKIHGSATVQSSSKPMPYDPRSKRHKVKPYDRKTMLDLQDFAKTTTNSNIKTTGLDSLPGNSLGDIGNEYSHSHRQKTDDAFKQHTEPKVNQSERGSQKFKGAGSSVKLNQSPSSNESKHFARKNKLYHVDGAKDDEIVRSNNVTKLLGLGNSEISKHYFARKQKFQTLKDPAEPFVRPLPKQDFSQSWEYFKDKPVSKTAIPVKKVVEMRKDLGCQKNQQGSEEAGTQHINPLIEKGNSCSGNMKKAEKMLKAFGSGWKKDWLGNWVKDEDAEFDSDEEPPDVT